MSIIIPGSNLAPKISFTTNAKIEVVAPTLTATGTVTGSKGLVVPSSLAACFFQQRWP